MKGINVGRVVLGGVVAGILMFILDGVVHGQILKSWWTETMAYLGRKPSDDMSGMPYFLVYDLFKGWAAVALYAAIRPRFGAGAKTAVLAALAVWFLAVPTALLGMLPMAFFGRKFALVWALLAAIPVIVGALAGAWLYRESPASGAQSATG